MEMSQEKQQSGSSTKKRLICVSKRCRLLLLVQAVLLVLTGLFCLVVFPGFFSSILESKMMIKPGTIGYEAWKKPNIPTKIKIYLFSVKNPKEVENNRKPHLEEVGPFTYSEETERINEEFSKDGSYVSYETRKIWHYRPDESLPLDTVVTSVDIPALATAEFARGDWLKELSIGGMMKMRPSLFKNVSAREILFDGFSDPLLTVGSLFATPGGIPMDKFGWFYGRNGTTWSDGQLTMDTGTDDITKLGDIREWNGEKNSMYEGECGQLKGTAAGFLNPDPQRQFIEYFSTDICRPIRFDRDSMVAVAGVNSIKYSLFPEQTFSNSEPGCYNGDNLSYGVHNSTGCKGGDTTLKTFVSLPHFLRADPAFVNQFMQGSLRPEEHHHSASITVQESTSIPTEVLMRLQIMLQLTPNPNIGSFFTNLRPVLLPVLWFDAQASITVEIADQLKLVGFLPCAAEVMGVTCVLLGLGLFFVFLFITYKQLARDSKIEQKSGKS